VNHTINHITWLIVGMNYYYAALHYIITVGVLLWVYFRRPEVYRSVRTVLGTTTWLGLIGFYFYALAPPRLAFPHYFIDTVVVHHTWGSWGTSGMDSVSNQYAAMPSLHIGWSTWCALTVFMLAKNKWVKWGALLYPVFTFTVIIATANHFVLDAIGGLITITIGFGLQRLLQGRPAYRLPILVEPDKPRSRELATSSPDGVPPQRSNPAGG
jgi:hypothetical protein